MSHFHSQRFEDLEENFENYSRVDRSLENRQRLGLEIFDLTVSNPSQLGFQFPTEWIGHSFLNDFSWKYQPDPKGLESARKAILDYYMERENHLPGSISTEEIFLTSGTSESYSLILKAITNPGDKILVKIPGYPLLDYLAKWELLEVIGFQDYSELEDLSDPKIKAILLVQPNNPTGEIIRDSDWRKISDWAKRSDRAILVDEVFSDYIGWAEESGNEQKIQIFRRDPEIPIFHLNGISKMLGLPGWKLAWIHAQIPEEYRSILLNRLEWLTDSYLSVNSISQELLPGLFRSRPLIQNQIRNRLRRNFIYLKRMISEEKKITLPTPAGGWTSCLKLNFPGGQFMGDEWVFHLVENYGVVVHPGDLYQFAEPDGSSMVLVISLIVEEENFRNGVDKLLQAFQETWFRT
jgi:aspartate/methionine/tyrosine aminotransferase